MWPRQAPFAPTLHDLHSNGQAVPAELPARELARLPVLGQRARAVSGLCPGRTARRSARAASASEISTFHPASDKPRNRHAASAQLTTRVVCELVHEIAAHCPRPGPACRRNRSGRPKAPLDPGMIGAEPRADDRRAAPAATRPARAAAAGASADQARQAACADIIGIALRPGRACTGTDRSRAGRRARRRSSRLRPARIASAIVLRGQATRRASLPLRTDSGTPRSRRSTAIANAGRHRVEMAVDDALDVRAEAAQQCRQNERTARRG